MRVFSILSEKVIWYKELATEYSRIVLILKKIRNHTFVLLTFSGLNKLDDGINLEKCFRLTIFSYTIFLFSFDTWKYFRYLFVF